MKKTSAKQLQENKLNEHIQIAAIISDNHMKVIYDDHAKHGVNGYFDALDIIKETTHAFYNKFKKQIETINFEWEEFYSELNEIPYLSQVICYDDLVIHWAQEWLKQYFDNGRQQSSIKI
jgi:hypothetical protein